MAPPPSSKPAKSVKQGKKVTCDRLLAEAPKYKHITTSVLSDRLHINGYLARKAIKELTAKGLIRTVSAHASHQIYARATKQ